MDQSSKKSSYKDRHGPIRDAMSKVNYKIAILSGKGGVGKTSVTVNLAAAFRNKQMEVGIFDAAEPNAFATGMSRNNALVSVSTGLLRNMSSDEVEAVLGHEVTHVSNGDMVTMGLIQGVINTFVIFASRVIGHVVDRVVFKTERGFGPAYYIVSIVAQIFLSILASMIVMWFSRRREFRADAGGASLAGRGKMIGALQDVSEFMSWVGGGSVGGAMHPLPTEFWFI